MSTAFDTMLACLMREVVHFTGDPCVAACFSNGQKDIVSAADRIAAGAGLTEGQAACDLALESVFNRLRQGRGDARFMPDWPENRVQYPSAEASGGADARQNIVKRWKAGLSDIIFKPEYINSLLLLMEQCFSYTPSSTHNHDRPDVSLFHHGKAAAAIGCCLSRCPDAKKPFLLYSLDLSGIQTFIYTISGKGALKSLRVRSFYLSIMMEHIADMILEACQLCRVNLIYSGGGRAQLLLPNDGQCFRSADDVVVRVNDFLRNRFGAALYLASGSEAASAEELSSSNPKGRCFSDIFRAASAMISRQKLQRYDAGALRELNRSTRDATDRECAVCGRSGRLQPHGEDEMICDTCLCLERFSNTLTVDDLLLAVDVVPGENAIPLPGGLWLSRVEVDVIPETVRRLYCVGGHHPELPRAVHLHIGNYRVCNGDGSAMTFDELADASTGLRQLGIFRADVDNLGALFASGFAAPGDDNPHRYETLSRYMALSAAMTAFFQREINSVMGQRNVSIVYSGGDDVFLVGAWNDALEAGLALQSAFARYTGGNVTLSGGLGLFTPHEPVGVLADITADLEDAAKRIEDGTKNAIALFAPEFVFHWDELRGGVIADKLPLLDQVISHDADEDAGNAFLYQVYTQLRAIKDEPIAIARLAYLLGRHAPQEPNAQYDVFSKSVYRWAMDADENRALQAAILLHVYAHRGRDEDNE